MTFLKDSPLQGADEEKVFMVLIQAIFHPAIGGIFLAAVLAAIMSTVDSQLLVASSSVTQGLLSGLFQEGSQRQGTSDNR